MSKEQIAINRLMCGNTAHSCKADYIQLAIQALEKQVAKKPYILPISKTDNFEYCPNCKTDGPLVAPSMNYCCDCGQKLDWGGEE